MKIVDFKETNRVIAKNQPEYQSLPAHVSENGAMTCCWKLDDAEIKEILKTKRIYVQILTFNNPLQPHLLTIKKPEL